MKSVKFNRSIPTVGEYDVIVCGGGPAGIVAAISAARCGKRVALIERFGFLGGAATAGYVVPISGFHFKGDRVVDGIAWEIVEQLVAVKGAQIEYPKGNVSFDPELYKYIAERMVVQSGVDLYTNASLVDCVMSDRHLTHAVIVSKSGIEAIAGKCFIDATGDGDLCYIAGVPMLAQSGECQPMSLCFILSGVKTDTPLLRNCIHHDGKSGASCNEEIRAYLMGELEKECAPKFGGPWFNTILTGTSVQ